MDNKRKFEVVVFGESMLKLSVPKGERLENARKLDLDLGGAETNFLAGLAALNRKCAWCSKLPNNPTGKYVINKLHGLGIDTKAVVFGEGRIGTYYVEYGATPRPTQVYYDRQYAIINNLKSDEIDYDYFLDAKYLHLTGITAALSSSSRALVVEFVKQAAKRNVKLSFDINYRAKLWDLDTAKEVLLELIQGAEVLFCNRRDAENLFALHGNDQEIVAGLAKISNAKNIITSLSDRGVIGFDGEEYYTSSAVPVEIVDRLGAGDALAAGVLHGLLDQDLQKGLDYGTALAALSMSMHGDMLYSNSTEIEQILTRKLSDLAR